ncbi:MAG TPA: hypothetical protein HA252_01010 [Candidatus Diapherotrites archaeon]|uniref:Uncharacterized protein n=1 Tax=Candidatus Iainarchaeum sp. TaxID=3101447 RepID=A0A7J4JF94_9ARCH|nr:hypothetical protein [Candidatus Diapherotrites archaeon]HIH15964.1 hypothetical protein [Candidatus Diapherotrites archaeon]
MRKGNYEVLLKRHAFLRALQRQVHPGLIEATIETGRMVRFGKDRVKFVKRFREFTASCVDEIVGHTIRIVTIEKNRR